MDTIKSISLIRNQKLESGEVRDEILLNFKIKNETDYETMNSLCNSFNEILDNNNPNENVFFIPNERILLNIDLNQMNKEAKEKLLNDLDSTFTDNQLTVISDNSEPAPKTETETQGE